MFCFFISLLLNTFSVQFPRQLQVSLQPIEAFFNEFNIEDAAADTLFEQPNCVETTEAEGESKLSASPSTPVPLMDLVTRPIDRRVENLNGRATSQALGLLPIKRTSVDTPLKRTVQVPDLLAQTVFNGLSMKNRENAWNKFDYVKWATLKHATDEDTSLSSWRKYRSSDIFKFQESNMDKFLSNNYVLTYIREATVNSRWHSI